MAKSNRTIREEKDSNLLNFIRFRFFPYWPLFGFLLVVAAAGAYVYWKLSPPAYEASADLLIKDEKKGSDDSKIVESLNLLTTKKTVEDEMEVLQSQTLMKEVVRNLYLYAPIVEKGRFRTAAAYVSSPVAIEMAGFDTVYKGREKALIGPVPFTYDFSEQTVIVGKKSYPINQWITWPNTNTQIRFIPNSRFTGASGKQLWFTVLNPKMVTGYLTHSLNVAANNKLSSVVTLTLRDEVPRRAEDILNELISVYNHASINDKNQLAINTLAFVENRLRHVRLELDSAEGRIQNYKTENGGANLSEQSTAFLHNVTQNDQKVSELSMKLASLNEVEKYVNNYDGHSSVVPSTLGLSDEGLTALLQKLYDARNKYEQLRKTVGENNPMVQSLTNEIEKIRPNILENIRIQKMSIQAGLNDLNTRNVAYESRLQGIPKKERTLLESSRQQATLSNVYSFLLQKREEASLSYASTVPDSRVINLGESTMDPVSPRRTIIFGVAMAMAVGLGILIVMFMEFFSNKVLFRREIEAATAIPIVAEISSAGKHPALVNNAGEPTFLDGQFRQLKTALGLHTRTNKKKKLLITSSTSGEGKTFIASNLARSLAFAGKKVILLDLDRRNPQCTVDFAIEEEKGLADYLEGGLEPYEIIKSTSQENLFIAGAGKNATDTQELTFNKRLGELFDYLEGVFDFIIVDTSPVYPVNDAYILSEYCDRTIYVVRHGYTRKAYIELLDENNRIKPLKDLVIVFNSIKSRGFFKGRYGLDLGYGNDFAIKSRSKIRRPGKRVSRTNS